MADSEVLLILRSSLWQSNNDENYNMLFLWQVSKRLKDIPFKIQTASLKGRRAVISEIRDILSTPG